VPMQRLFAALTSLALALACRAQDRPSLAEILAFEAPHTGSTPAGWSASPAGSIAVDGQIVHGGHWSVRIERQPDTANPFSTITRSIPVDFTGTSIELHGFVRTESVSEFVALWMREDGESGQTGLAFDSMQSRRINGTRDWTEYSISVPVHSGARQLFFGFLLAGAGKAWVDDLRLLVDGKPVWDAPKVERPKTIIETDQEFNGGSKISISALSPVQIENLATLGRVWGFLKYHHPGIVSGQRHWDYDLFRVMPSILAARDRAAANAELARWVASLGPVPPCQPCAVLDETGLHLRPQLAWIDSEPLLGPALSRSLRAIHRNRPDGRTQFYISLTPNVGNPIFHHEPAYEDVRLPDPGFQLLALYRFWNIIEYWFPYRDVLGEDWNRVLAGFIPRIALAKTSDEYQRELMALIARAHDTHANLWSSLQLRPPVGKCAIPVVVRFIENRPVISGYLDPAAGPATGLQPGDILERRMESRCNNSSNVGSPTTPPRTTPPSFATSPAA
jgi:hypothetical protein